MSTELAALDDTERALLTSYEAVIQQGLESFVEVGNALAAVRDRGLWREFASFEVYCKTRWGFSQWYSYKLTKSAEVVSDLDNCPNKPTVESHARPLADVPREQRAEVWKAVVESAPKDGDGEPKITAKHVEQVVAKALDKPAPHVSNNSGNNEWYTPPEFLESARIVLGAIDCDPASSEVANRNVKAKKIYTAEDSGLESPRWGSRVWMNPPYSQPLCAMFCTELAKRVAYRQVKEAIVLVNNATETEWFSTLASHASAVVFPTGRIRFLDSSNQPKNTPLQGQCFLYFGDRFSAFLDEFSKYGWGAIVQ